MSTCCDTSDSHAPSAGAKDTFTVAVAGNPNCGKTTIFNALTGLRQRVANYPGVTVEKKTGRCTLADGRVATVIDLPGTYSLVSRSPDEHVAMEVLRGLRPDTPAPDAVVVVVDASNLQRNLYLVSQLIELGRPMVVALNMMDIALRRGIDVSPQLLEKELGIPVVPVVGHKREGIDDLRKAITRARVAPAPDWPLPTPFQAELATIGAELASVGTGADHRAHAAQDAAPGTPRYAVLAERLLVGDHTADLEKFASHERIRPLVDSSRSRLQGLGIDPMQADIEAHYRWIETVAGRVVSSLDELAAMGNPAPSGVLEYETPRKRYFSDSVDAVLIHKVWGLVIFALIMATLFVTIFWLAKPIMEGINQGIAWLGTWLTSKMGDGPIKDLLKDGVFAGVGAVVVFVPQIAILFFFLAILEDSGYLARAAFLMDRLLAKVGLHGKSFIPLLSSFACAIPGIMATRTIEDRKGRLATILIAPFMSCSARLPVYTLLIGTFFAAYGALVQAGIMLALYALGIVAAAGTAWVFKRTLLKGPASAFILELPTYKLPQASQITRHVVGNTWQFLAKAGTVIFVLSIILWAMTYYPQLPEQRREAIGGAWKPSSADVRAALTPPPADDTPQAKLRVIGQTPLPYGSEGIDRYNLPDGRRIRVGSNGGGILSGELTAEEKERLEAIKKAAVEKQVGAEQLRHSIAGRIGRAMEPAIRPLGYDWKMGVGLVGAFAAREVFVSTMGIIYSVGDVGDETTDLQKAMREDVQRDSAGNPVRDAAGRPRPLWSIPVALSLLVWFVLAMQCISTVAIVRRETGGWRWPLFMILYMNTLAYLAALVTYQVARALA